MVQRLENLHPGGAVGIGAVQRRIALAGAGKTVAPVGEGIAAQHEQLVCLPGLPLVKGGVAPYLTVLHRQEGGYIPAQHQRPQVGLARYAAAGAVLGIQHLGAADAAVPGEKDPVLVDADVDGVLKPGRRRVLCLVLPGKKGTVGGAEQQGVGGGGGQAHRAEEQPLHGDVIPRAVLPGKTAGGQRPEGQPVVVTEDQPHAVKVLPLAEAQFPRRGLEPVAGQVGVPAQGDRVIVVKKGGPGSLGRVVGQPLGRAGGRFQQLDPQAAVGGAVGHRTAIVPHPLGLELPGGRVGEFSRIPAGKGVLLFLPHQVH